MVDIIDVCCGSRMFYFDKQDNRVVCGDIRQHKENLCNGEMLNVSPDIVFDFRKLPFSDEQFHLVVFDPPHIDNATLLSWLAKKYGALDPRNWRADLSRGFSECWRVLKPHGTLIFKWSEARFTLGEVLSCFSQKPVFGHTTTKNLKTHWIVFYKMES